MIKQTNRTKAMVRKRSQLQKTVKVLWKGGIFYELINLYKILYNWPIDIMVRVFANGLGDLGSVPGWVIPKTQKMLLDASFV